jgi:hypothetical protein
VEPAESCGILDRAFSVRGLPLVLVRRLPMMHALIRAHEHDHNATPPTPSGEIFE